MNSYDSFISNANNMGIHLNDTQIEQFDKYYNLLIEWNSFMNLTAITDFDDVCLKHFLDSISLIKAFDCSKSVKVLDIGTGAGFPGIPLKIAYPSLEITLVDSLGKRVKFLNEVISSLGLSNINAFHSRAEDFIKEPGRRESFDLCVSRAVANLTTLSEYCLPYIKVGGEFISYKSEKIAEEKKSAEHGISILGGKIDKEIDFVLPGSDIYRNLFVIKKVKTTPSKFPRKAGLPAKEPLQ